MMRSSAAQWADLAQLLAGIERCIDARIRLDAFVHVSGGPTIGYLHQEVESRRVLLHQQLEQEVTRIMEETVAAWMKRRRLAARPTGPVKHCACGAPIAQTNESGRCRTCANRRWRLPTPYAASAVA